MGQNRKRLPLAMSFGKFFHIGLRLGIASQKEDCRFGEGPLQMRIADLGSRRAIGFACGFSLAFYKTGIGGKILHLWKAIDIIYCRT